MRPTANECTLLPLSTLKSTCANCSLRELCLPSGIAYDDLDKLDSIISSRRRLVRGETLYSAGETFRALYAVRTGFFKTQIQSIDGREQIVGFQIPGELFGFDGLGANLHTVQSIALEDSEVCTLPFDELERIASEFPPLQQQLHRIMGREIVRDNSTMLLLGSMKAEERVAAFLLNLSERYSNLGYAPNEFVLRMTRQEIGSYLGLKLETVSRTISKFQEQKLLEAKGKKIRLLNISKLKLRVNIKSN